MKICAFLVTNMLCIAAAVSAAECNGRSDIESYVQNALPYELGHIAKWSAPIRYRFFGEAAADYSAIIRSIMETAQQLTQFDIAEDKTPGNLHTNAVFLFTDRIEKKILDDASIVRMFQKRGETIEHARNALLQGFKKGAVHAIGRADYKVTRSLAIFNTVTPEPILRTQVLKIAYRTALGMLAGESNMCGPSLLNTNVLELKDFTHIDRAFLATIFSQDIRAGMPIGDARRRTIDAMVDGATPK